MSEEESPRQQAEERCNTENPIINKGSEYIKISIPDQLKTDEFRFIKLRGKTKIPKEPDFTKAANFAHDDPSLLRHLAKGYNYGIVPYHIEEHSPLDKVGSERRL